MEGKECRKGDADEQYVFHRWFEIFVGCALAAVDEWISKDAVFLRCGAVTGRRKMGQWWDIEKHVHGLSAFVMKLEYAQNSEAESAEREWWLTRAGGALVEMNDRFTEASHRW